MHSIIQILGWDSSLVRRLWLMKATENGLPDDVEPRLQVINKAGHWGRGRKVVLGRLHASSTQRQQDFPFLTEQEKIHLRIDPFPVAQPVSQKNTEENGSNHIHWETAQRAIVYHFTPDHLRISHILGKDGLLVPEAAKKQALESIATIAPLLSVFSEVVGEGQAAAEKVQSNSRLHLYLQPAADGLRIACFVRPFWKAATAAASYHSRKS